MLRVTLTQHAQRDLDAIVEYIRMDSPHAADALEDDFLDAIVSLREFPDRCGYAIESTRWGYPIRTMLVHAYRVLYTVRDADVTVRIVHGHQRSPIARDE